MGKVAKRLCLQLLVLCCILGSYGCTPTHSKRELNSIAIVMGLGLDASKDTSKDISLDAGKLRVTAQVVRTGSLSGGGAKSGGGPSNAADAMYWNLVMEGNDIFPMLRGSVKQSNRNLYISHNQVIVFGEELAKEGLAPFMDYFFREREMRYNVLLAVSEQPAGDILKISPNLENLPAQEIAKLLKIQARQAESPTESLFDFAVDLKSGKKAAVLPLINAQQTEDEEETVYVDGCAVFKDWAMVGTLNAAETRGFLWTSGDITSTVFTVPVEDTRFSLTVTGKKGEMDVIYTKEKGLWVRFDVSADAVVGHVEGVYDLHKQESLREIQSACSQYICNEVCAAVGKARTLKSDIFGVSEYLERYMPGIWQAIEGEWENIFPTITYEVCVKSNVRRTGSLVDPVLDEGVGI